MGQVSVLCPSSQCDDGDDDDDNDDDYHDDGREDERPQECGLG